MSRSFHQHFDQHAAWRRNFAHRLKWLGSWLRENDLLDPAVAERMRELESQMRSSKVTVAFVAEFSRGKSELINSIFFAGYGRRIMPASAGRTTMCPTELGYDPSMAPCLRLLPISTRLEVRSLSMGREATERWVEIPINIDDPESLSAAVQKVAEVDWVALEDARALGFWRDEAPEDNPLLNAQGQVEVPRWRHALLNIPHPLLEQGLVILDTPGLNAIGAEPELTVNLIPQAHAVVFILGADTGVTRSDLDIWRDHLLTNEDPGATRIVVLNKIDTLWDSLTAPGQIDAQLERQWTSVAETLGMPRARVLPVSAQKGLQAKISQDAALLQASRLPALEAALGTDLLGRRESVLRLAVSAGVTALRNEATRVMDVRRRDLSDQAMEMESLRGKNSSVVRYMRVRVEQEQAEFKSSNVRVLALRSVKSSLLRQISASLDKTTLRSALSGLAAALHRSGLKLNVIKTYAEAFAKLRANLQRAQTQAGEIQAMLNAAFKRLNAEYGFSLHAPELIDLSEFVKELDRTEKSHLHYLSVSNLLRLAQKEFCDRLANALEARVFSINDAAMAATERWARAAMSQLDSQLKERAHSFSKRIESLDRIQEATDGIDGRLAEIQVQNKDMDAMQVRLQELTDMLLTQELPSGALELVSGSERRVA